MVFEQFKLHAVPHIVDAYCTNPKCKKKGNRLEEVSNGFLSVSLFCPECQNVYLVKLERMENPPKKYVLQCLEEIERKKRKLEASVAFAHEVENGLFKPVIKRAKKKSTNKKKK